MKHLVKTYIGIDPGYSGAIAVFYNNEIKTIQNPRTFPEILKIFREIKSTMPNILIGIEKVGMNPMDMKEGGKAFGIQKMVINYNDFVNALDALQLPYIPIAAQKWQRGLKLYIKGEGKKERKDRYRYFAAENFPMLKVTRRNQDAICIMRYLYELVYYGNSDIMEKTRNYDRLIQLNEKKI